MTLLFGIAIGALGSVIGVVYLFEKMASSEWWDRPPGKIVTKLMKWGVIK